MIPHRPRWHRRYFPVFCLAAAWTLGPGLLAADQPTRSARDQAQRILNATGIRGGLIVHLGCGAGKLTVALRPGAGFLVHGLDPSAANVERARALIRTEGLAGVVSVERLRGVALPYRDHLVNLVVAEDLCGVPMAEIMRVLCPRGVAYVRGMRGWTKTVKPPAVGTDQWTHVLHAADNNAVAHDRVVGPPQGIQWVGTPRRARQHENLASISAVVTSGGRVFSIEDDGPIASVLLPARWSLVARDAFNGVVLWRRPMGPWEWRLRPFRMGPPDIARKLVAVGNRVYTTLGYGRPVCALDAATGQTCKTYEQTTGTAEILWQAGRLFLVAGRADAQRAAAAARRRGRNPPPESKRIVALEADSGDLLWRKSDADTAGLMPMTLAVSGGRVFFQNPRELLCLDAETGREKWRAARPVAARRPGFSAPTLVVHGDVVLSADRATPAEVRREPQRAYKQSWLDAPRGDLIAFAADTGKRLWACPCRECFHAPVDVLVADGLVWSGELVVAKEPGITVGRDPATGQIKRRRPPDQTFFQVGMPHHRCYRNRATDRFLVLGRAGIELIDVTTGVALPNHWVRGTCQFGVLPANGLLYAPPHSCACFSQAKLNGFYALGPVPESAGGTGAVPASAGRSTGVKHAGANAGAPRGDAEGALERGPAFPAAHVATDPVPGAASASTPATAADWPTYRHDPRRSGAATTAVRLPIHRAWQTDLGGHLSSVTVAAGKVFVAAVERHTVCAVDAESGTPLWHYTTAGRVDSPPTICQQHVLFGSADGWVYCLRAADGQLVWRRRAGPIDRRIVAYGQLESVWPVSGSVLVLDDVVLLAAGRSSYLDGGIYLERLDPRTGKSFSVTRVNSRDPRTGRQPKGAVHTFDLAGALPDVLSSDGTFVYMRQVKFDRQGVIQSGLTIPPPGGRQRGSGRTGPQRPAAQGGVHAAATRRAGVHLFSPTGFLDDSWWHRSYWILGTRFYTGYRDWFRAGREVPAGRILVMDDHWVYGFGRKPEYYYWSTPQEYHLFRAARDAKTIKSPKRRARLPAWGQRQIQYDWSRQIPLRVRAMVLAGNTLFVAGPPKTVDEQWAYLHRDDASLPARLKTQTQALEGGRGAVLLAIATSDGATRAQYQLDALPAWDGMVAANGHIYVATTNGKVLCFAPDEK